MMTKRFLLCVLLGLLTAKPAMAVEHHKHTHKKITKHKVVTETKKPIVTTQKKPEPKKTENLPKPVTPPLKHHYLSIHRYHFHNPHLIKRSIAFAANTEHHMIDLIHNAVASLNFTSYRFGGTYFDLSRGIYEVDCSDYVDHLLNLANPRAYASLVSSTHTEKPTTRDYYAFFKNLPVNETPYNNWQRVDDVEQLKAGDILVFRYHQNQSGGHVMVVMDNPKPAPNDNDAYIVQVSDSAVAGHSDDTRTTHASGVGIGTLMLKVDPNTGEPHAYAWRVDSNWQPIDAAMAEPISTNS